MADTTESEDIPSSQTGRQASPIKKRAPEGKTRLNWIDQGRGFVMFILVLTELMPSLWRSGNWFADFFFDHPPSDAQYINIYDVGVPAFFLIIGLLLLVSFKKRQETKGTRNAVLNAIVRWGMIYALGLIIILLTYTEGFGAVKTIAPGVSAYVVSWDVIPAIGFVGLISIPFMFLPSMKSRLISAYVMMSFFQVMLFIPGTYWREYAAASVHGGIIGGIFVMTSFVLVGSCIGEYYILDKTTPIATKNKNLALFALLNLAIGFGLWLIPGGYPNKRQSTMSWATLSIGIVILGLLVFVKVDYKDENLAQMNPVNKTRIVILKSYGENPFLIYAMAVIPDAILGALVAKSIQSQLWYQVVVWVVLVGVISIIAWVLYRKRKIISTTKIAAGVLIIILILVVILVPTGIVSIPL